MIKDGRPYTSEGHWLDTALITDHPQREQETVFNWICTNIYPRKTELRGRTSYVTSISSSMTQGYTSPITSSRMRC